MRDLLHKKILFIGPVFHNYHTDIARKLSDMGAEVDFEPEREYGVAYKVINNYANSRLPDYQRRHYLKIINRAKGKAYDYLFVIRGYKLPENFTALFKADHPACKTIMYQWDSNKANPFLHIAATFDRVFSFDFEDCRVASLTYHPLFYTDDVKQAASHKTAVPMYDFFFMGWYFPERYEAVLRFRTFAQSRGYKLRAFLYMPFMSYIKERLRGGKPDLSIVSLRHMKRDEYLSTLCASKVMVDVSNPNQTGLAMRIIEALACRTKVLTNNRRLKDDSLFTEEYVDFFDEKHPDVNANFLNYNHTATEVKVLSIEEWIVPLFSPFF